MIKPKIKLDARSKLPLARQIYDDIRKQITTGELPSGVRLPSSRQLAEQIGLARGTVVVAYERLSADGYIETQIGSGTHVSHHLPPTAPAQAKLAEPSRKIQEQTRIARLSTFGRRLLDLPERTHYSEAEISFYFWRPDMEEVPIKQLLNLLARRSKTFDPELYDYQTEPLGYRPLRESIARYLHRSRGVKCSADHIAITNGWKQSLDLAARLHVERGDLIAVENPCHPGIRHAFALQGGSIYPVPTDANGIDVEHLMRASNEQFRVLYVSPSHQLPLGSVLSLKRRMELLGWAAQSGTLIFEDEHDSEYCYTGSPILPLKAMDNNDQIILQGTFHKVLFPSLAVSYLVLPHNLVGVYTRALDEVSESVPTFVQAALADFIRDGYLRRHMRKMRALYSARRQALLDSLHKHFGSSLAISGESSGMHIVVRLKSRLRDSELISQALAAGVAIPSTRDFYLGSAPQGEFMLGYACLSERKIADGVRRLARIFKENR